MQLCVRDLVVETLPDCDGDVLCRRNCGLEFGDFEIQVAVVVDADNFALEDVFQLFEIDYKAGGGIYRAGDRDLKGVIVPVTVAIRALAEDALVLLRGPRLVPIEVGGGEFGFAG